MLVASVAPTVKTGGGGMKAMDDRTFGNIVRTATWRKRLTNQELARELGRSLEFVQAIFFGQVSEPIDAATAQKLQHVLDLDAIMVEVFRRRHAAETWRDEELWDIATRLETMPDEPR